MFISSNYFMLYFPADVPPPRVAAEDACERGDKFPKYAAGMIMDSIDDSMLIQWQIFRLDVPSPSSILRESVFIFYFSSSPAGKKKWTTCCG